MRAAQAGWAAAILACVLAGSCFGAENATQPPTALPDDSLVKELLQMDKWVQAEKAAKHTRIDASSIQVFAYDTDKAVRRAVLFESPADRFGARYSSDKRWLKIGPSALHERTAFFDMGGKPIPTEVEKTAEEVGFYYLHFTEPIEFDGVLKFMVVGEGALTNRQLRQERKVWRVTAGNATPFSLDYYKVILPASAICLDAYPPAISIGETDGRTVVTIRAAPSEDGAGHYDVAFLWPEKDGTSLKDVPKEYRGLRDKRDLELAEYYRWEMEKIRKGRDFHERDTPVKAVLAWNSAVICKDLKRCGECTYHGIGNLPGLVIEGGMVEEGSWKNLSCFVNRMDLLGTPPWPDKPEEGRLHPVYMCHPGTLMRNDMIVCIYQKGQWLRLGNAGNPWSTDLRDFEQFR